MIGAIKRRWKSKKAKVLHKGGELSTTNDSCPAASRGFVDGCEEFDKMIKPPSPRQIHPVLENIEVKYSTNSPHQHQHHNCSNKKSTSTLPNSSDETCPFIRVNSGRIELVNCTSSNNKDVGRHSLSTANNGSPSPHYHLPHPPNQGNGEILSEKLKRRLGGRLRNDTRHSWCGSVFRDGQKMRGGSGLVLSAPGGPPDSSNSNSTIQEKQRLLSEDPTYSDPIEEKEILKLRTSLLQERLDVIETLTKNSQSWQKEEKKEVEKCMSDLATQVSRAVTFQQLMKSEVEKLQERILDLETHNRAMATMIVPTLMKLHDTIGRGRPAVVSLEAGSEKRVEERQNPERIGETSSSNQMNEGESWCQTPTTPSPKSLKQKKIDCRIPRINYRLSRTKQQSHETTTGGESSPEPNNSNSCFGPGQRTNASLPPNSSLTGQSSVSLKKDSNSRLSPSSFPKSKSSSTSIHSKDRVISPAQTKSSTFSGIPRMASPRPPLSQDQVKGTPTPSSRNTTTVSTTNNKNDSQKTPFYDLHNNGNSRLPIRKNLSNKPKTNPGKVNSVIHHGNQNGGKGNSTVGTNKMSTNSSPSTGTTSCPGSIIKPLGKDEGYSTMSSEALAEQENSKDHQDKDLLSGTITKSNTFSTFCGNHSERRGGSLGGSPQRKQLITGVGSGVRRNCTSLPKSSMVMTIGNSSTSSNVRIIRGIPSSSYETQDGGCIEEGETMTIEEPSSTSTILWEDSDDSDILFLPLEVSSGASSPTLVPPSWSSASSSRAGLIPSSSSFSTSSTTTNTSTIGPEHPLRRTHGEELVVGSGNNPVLLLGSGEHDEVQIEERALIEKWMRLEDVRNQVHLGDEWAWDWDGVERTYIKTASSSTTKKIHGDFGLPELWTYSPKRIPKENRQENRDETGDASPSSTKVVDSNTWTKSKNKKSNEASSSFPKESGNDDRNGNEFKKNTPSQIHWDRVELETEEKKQLITTATSISEMSPIVTNVETPDVTTTVYPGNNEEDPPSPPPVIEFTPEYYRLVKYGSNSSVNDKELLITTKGGGRNKRNSTETLSQIKISQESWNDESPTGKMDDKISQTDFGSSLENLSVSSELFTECRNCLELIKRLVGGIDESCGTSPSGSYHDKACDKEEEGPGTLDRARDNERNELVADHGAPTTWISVPKGLPTIEVDRIFEILSSSESEDVLSPQSCRGNP